MAQLSWYRDGLRFECSRCGYCCTGDPGTVRVSDAEIDAMARQLTLDDAEFRRLYTRALRGGDISLVEKRNRDCIFWDPRAGCRVYPVRPRQCRSWPFWRAVVYSPETWEVESASCPGMNQGALHDASTISEISEQDGTSGSR